MLMSLVNKFVGQEFLCPVPVFEYLFLIHSESSSPSGLQRVLSPAGQKLPQFHDSHTEFDAPTQDGVLFFRVLETASDFPLFDDFRVHVILPPFPDFTEVFYFEFTGEIFPFEDVFVEDHFLQLFVFVIFPFVFEYKL